MTGPTSEAAPAKVNLTLHVTGRRSDGYHLLDSLVVFADIADVIEAQTADALSLVLAGEGAVGLAADADNLVLRAARLFDGAPGARITLHKHLPVAAGIGGGSADAAATLRLLSRLWQRPLPAPDDILTLGADVPVCLHGTAARMRGVGERLDPVPGLPEGLGIVLANPRVPVSTPDVFRALERRDNPPMAEMPAFTDAAKFAAWLRAQRNDLQPAAVRVAPVISDVLRALQGTGPMITRMSGSGATCFALYPSVSEAQHACNAVQGLHPGWWLRAGAVL